MRRFSHCSLALFVVALVALSWAQNEARAQSTPVTNQTRQALEFYGGRSAFNTLSEMPRRSPIQPASPGQLQHNGKPFQSTTSGPTVSPYMNLFRDERGESSSVPNYYAFVRPQMEQQAAFQQQQREIQQLQRQSPAGSERRSATVPGVGTQARYMDTAQFYGGWQR